MLTLVWYILAMKGISKFTLTIGSITEWNVVMFTYPFSRVSKTYSIVNWNVVESCCLYGFSSNVLYSISKAVI